MAEELRKKELIEKGDFKKGLGSQNLQEYSGDAPLTANQMPSQSK